MHFTRPTLRDLAIGLGLLRPLRRAEENDALRKCTRISTVDCVPVRHFIRCWTASL